MTWSNHVRFSIGYWVIDYYPRDRGITGIEGRRCRRPGRQELGWGRRDEPSRTPKGGYGGIADPTRKTQREVGQHEGQMGKRKEGNDEER